VEAQVVLRHPKDITSSPVAIADMIDAGFIQTEEELRSVVGHKDGQTTARYANMAPEKKGSVEK
jgi:hypothetical protein